MIDIKTLAKELAKQQKKGEIIVSPADIALMFSYEPDSTAIRQILEDPTFPPSITLTPGGHRRYRRQDVVEWIDRKFEAESQFVTKHYRA